MSDGQAVDVWTLADMCTPWCIHTVVTLRVAEQIAAGAEDIGQIAQASGCDAEALHCVLSHLADRGVFAALGPGRFGLNDAARQLIGAQLGMSLDGVGGRFAHAWGTMLEYVRTGRPAYAERFGRSFWDDLDANPRLADEFDRLIGPEGHGPAEPDVPLDGGWEAVHTVVDVGGGTGAQLAAILRGRPWLRGTLVDKPRTAARSAPIFAEAGVSDRAATAGQSFFDPLPPGADVYLLKSVLNDWPDAEALAILRRCAEAARPGGRVLLLSGVIADGAPRRLTLEMLLCGGRHRPLADFAELARAAGLTISAVGRQRSGEISVECRPA
jgi:hypothetical protein